MVSSVSECDFETSLENVRKRLATSFLTLIPEKPYVENFFTFAAKFDLFIMGFKGFAANL